MGHRCRNWTTALADDITYPGITVQPLLDSPTASWAWANKLDNCQRNGGHGEAINLGVFPEENLLSCAHRDLNPSLEQGAKNLC
jgi:hypothetical protein